MKPGDTVIWKAPADPFGMPCTIIAVRGEVVHIAYTLAVGNHWERVEQIVPLPHTSGLNTASSHRTSE